MLTLSNTLSFCRFPLAFLFLNKNPVTRLAAILLAMISDVADGYLARRNRSTTSLGAILDPLADKFFLYFSLTVFYCEQRLAVGGVLAMLSRDIALLMYACLMGVGGRLSAIQFRAIQWGKISTILQFIALIILTFGLALSSFFYFAFIVTGVLAFIELVTIASPWGATLKKNRNSFVKKKYLVCRG